MLIVRAERGSYGTEMKRIKVWGRSDLYSDEFDGFQRGNCGQVGVYYSSAGYNKHESLAKPTISGITSLECRLLGPERAQSASRSRSVQADVSNANMDKYQIRVPY